MKIHKFIDMVENALRDTGIEITQIDDTRYLPQDNFFEPGIIGKFTLCIEEEGAKEKEMTEE